MKGFITFALFVLLTVTAQAAPVGKFSPPVRAAFSKIIEATSLDGKEHGFVVRADGSIFYASGGATNIQMQVPPDAQMIVHTHPQGENFRPSQTDINNEIGRSGISVVLGYDPSFSSLCTIYVITPDGKVSAGMIGK